MQSFRSILQEFMSDDIVNKTLQNYSKWCKENDVYVDEKSTLELYLKDLEREILELIHFRN